MERFIWKDCYIDYNDNVLIIGNSEIEKHIEFKDNCPIPKLIRNKKTGHQWCGNSKLDLKKLKLEGTDLQKKLCPILDFKSATRTVNINITDKNDIVKPHLKVEFKLAGESVNFYYTVEINSELPFITTTMYVEKLGDVKANSSYNFDDGDLIEALCFNVTHLKLESFEFFDKTDQNDQVVIKTNRTLYRRGNYSLNGNIFILNNYCQKEALMVVKNSPVQRSALNRRNPDLRIYGNSVLELLGTGIDFNNLPGGKVPYYSSTVGVALQDEIKPLYRRYFRETIKDNGTLFTLANTWGDRSQHMALCEEFIKAEINAAGKLGVDVLQIDDGWEKSAISDPNLYMTHVWEGYYDAAPDYWEVDKVKFPNGLEPIIEYARSKGVEIGLWFSPDSKNDFENWSKDVDTLYNFYKKYGIRHFKLDGIQVRSKKGEMNLCRMLEQLSLITNNDINFEMDVTAGDRFGYIYQQKYGILFVENRYTDWANYYPHNTLKNLWLLSEIIPPCRTQFEFLNNRRNQHLYGDDVLAPGKYSIDYLFASVMVSNPLVWMEMSHLDENDIEPLSRIISVFRQHAKSLYYADVHPIGQQPDGFSFTGFQAKINDKEGYLILLKEAADSDNFYYKLEGLNKTTLNLELLASNGKLECDPLIGEDGCLHVNFKGKRKYAFYKYSVL